MNELPDYAEVKRMSLQPGDVLLVECSRRITAEQAEAIQSLLKKHLPDYESLVLGPDMKIAVLGEGWPVPKDAL